MGTRTGHPRGRPKGAKNKRTAEREAAMKEMAAQIGKAVVARSRAMPSRI